MATSGFNISNALTIRRYNDLILPGTRDPPRLRQDVRNNQILA
jgi:hypothetical protein